MSKALLLILGLMASLAVAASPESDYQQGIDAFKQEQYQRALEHFERAEAQGLRLVSLSYNLGSTHYRLGNYAQAARHFDEIRDDSRWGALAEYNLGLIAERQHRRQQALAHYRAAYHKTDSERVRAMVRARQNALAASEGDVASAWQFYLSLAAGQDDNPALIQDTEVEISKESDTFMEIIASARGYLKGDRRNGIRMTAGYYGIHYSDLSAFNVDGISVGLFYDKLGTHWHTESGLRADSYWVDGESFSTGTSLLLSASRPVNKFNWRVYNELGYIQGATAFDFTTGLRNRLGTDLSGTGALGRWRIGYRNEYNQRDDLDLEDRFVSYSPIRHQFAARLINQLAENWTLQSSLSYRLSRYLDPNRQLDENDNVVQTRRSEDRLEAALAVHYDLNRTFRAFGEYRFTDNSANIDRYNYQSNQFTLGIDAMF